MTLYELTEEQMRLYEKLCDSVDTETGEVDPSLLEALDLNKEQIKEKGLSYAVVYKQAIADAKMLKEEEDRLVERRRRLEKNAGRLADALSSAMLQFDIPKLEGTRAVVTFRKSKKVVIADEELIPKKYKKVTFTPVKADIKAAIESGLKVKGAELVEIQNIQIK